MKVSIKDSNIPSNICEFINNSGIRNFTENVDVFLVGKIHDDNLHLVRHLSTCWRTMSGGVGDGQLRELIGPVGLTSGLDEVV